MTNQPKTKPYLRDEKHGNWKGDAVGYVALHDWVRVRRGTPTNCEHCPENRNDTYYYDWANKSGEYKRDLEDWLRLCKKCHRKYDNMGERVRLARRANYTHRIAQYSKDGTLLAYFVSVQDASDMTGTLRTSISNCIIGRSKTGAGYIWKKEDK